MRPVLLALALIALQPLPAAAGDAVTVVQETRVREPGRKLTVRHVAVLQNTAPYPIHRLRVTVELQDYFGAVLWARTATPPVSSLRPGDTTTLSFSTPQLDAHRRTRYRFNYRTATSPSGKPR
ncbi:MAG TPA: hypothetical protein VFN71_07610 [Methylomirabilota bacterium]|nr:hypothetical protein [Methylomirabilota bacterium]